MAPMKTENPEIHFAKTLANNDKKIRDKAVKRLKSWLSSKTRSESGLNEDELLKIWKGLFYCMWFSDKPLVQEELAGSLAEMIDLFKPTSTGVVFSKVFFLTMSREWLGIDKLRLNKFYFLMKKFLAAILQYLYNVDWNTNLVSETALFIEELLLDPKCPDGLKLFLAEYIMPTLLDICCTMNKFPPVEMFVVLLQPFFVAFSTSQSTTVHKTIASEILKPLLTMELKNKVDEIYSLPFESLAATLCELGAKKDIQTKVRKLLFNYTDLYRKKASDSVILTKTQTKKRKKVRQSKKKSVVNSTGDDEDSHDLACKKKKVSNVDTGIEPEEIVIAETIPEVLETNELLPKNTTNKKRKKKNNKPGCQEPSTSTKEPKQTTVEDTQTCDITSTDDPVKQTLTFSGGENGERVNGDSVNNDEDSSTTSKTISQIHKTPQSNKKKSKKSLLNNSIDTPVQTPSSKLLDSKVKTTVKKKRKALTEEDEPKPPVAFIKTPTPKAYVKRSAKTEPRLPKQKMVTNSGEQITPCSKTRRRKSVIFDVTKNQSITKKELKVSPAPAFYPDKKPVKGVLKTPSRAIPVKRSKATDFF